MFSFRNVLAGCLVVACWLLCVGCSSEKAASTVSSASKGASSKDTPATAPKKAEDSATSNAWQACKKLVKLASDKGYVEKQGDCELFFSSLGSAYAKPHRCGLKCAAHRTHKEMSSCLATCAAELTGKAAKSTQRWAGRLLGGRDIKVTLSDWKRQGYRNIATVTATVKTTPNAAVTIKFWPGGGDRQQQEVSSNADGLASVRFEKQVFKKPRGEFSILSKSGDRVRMGRHEIEAVPPALEKLQIKVENAEGAPGTMTAVDCYLELRRKGFETIDTKVRFAKGSTSGTLNLTAAAGVSFELGDVPHYFEGGKVSVLFDLDALAPNSVVTRITTSVPIYGKLPVALEVKGGVFKGTFSCKLSKAVFAKFRVFKGSGFTFGTQDVSVGTKGTAFFMFDKLRKFIGPSEMTVKDVDFLATASFQRKSFSDCVYRPQDGRLYALKRTARHATIRLLDRRTGASLGTTSVRSKTPQCPEKVPRSLESIAEFPSDDEMEKAIKALVAKTTTPSKAIR